MPAPARAVDPQALALPAPPGDAEAASPPLSDDDIHARLIEAIVDQRLLPGTKLIEDKLGQAFGVSRTRIRQVLIRLAQEQVVVLQPNKGASVAHPTVAESREVFEARRVVEAVLVQHFVAQASRADLQALAACIEAEEAARLAGDTAMALRQSGRFHLLLADAAGHRTFAGFLRKLVSRTSLILMSHGPDALVPQAWPLMPGPLGTPGTGERPRRWVQACRCDEHRGLLTALQQAVKARPKARRGSRAAAVAAASVATDVATPPPLPPANEAQALAQASLQRAMQLMTDHLLHIEAGLQLADPT